ncbi:hypothetical protein ACFOPX_03275 [Helicobacter baculiformis]|uniref:Uncharacterized protein n=1 Tax=Helicobacter baculiformis TaxID=427351 RepID=A0ABV7ZK68_9HELI|nr:hypothetical protein [Helicobacter baculiformis]
MLKLSTPHFIPPSVSYDTIKAALHSERFEEIVKVGRYFLRFDPQVSAEVFKRRLLVARLPVVLESPDTRVQDAFHQISKHGWDHFVYEEAIVSALPLATKFLATLRETTLRAINLEAPIAPTATSDVPLS